jgi:hypothetical protein
MLQLTIQPRELEAVLVMPEGGKCNFFTSFGLVFSVPTR